MYLDGFKGGTGAAPAVIRDHVGIPIEVAIAAVDQRLRDEGIRNQASIVAAGSIRSSADMAKAIALGADVVAIGTAALLALGCHLCQGCHTGSCSWGLTTQKPELTRRLDPEWGAERLSNLVHAWSHELQEDPGRAGRQRRGVASRQPRAPAVHRPGRADEQGPGRQARRDVGGAVSEMTITPDAGPMEGYRYVDPAVVAEGDMARIDSDGVYYKNLNEAVRGAFANGAKTVVLDNVNGQRYIGTGISGSDLTIEVTGTAGNDLAMFMDGPTVNVHGNAQDGVGNTMNAGRVVIHGDAGDVLGYGMRGGKVFVKGDVGYRVGIHMKAFESLRPIMICGGHARDFFGEYMAGGLLILLGMNSQFPDAPLVGSFVGTGMHGGEIFLRGTVEEWQIGKECGIFTADEADIAGIRPILEDYCAEFGMDVEEVLSGPFTKLVPVSNRPYGKLYAY